MANVTSNTFSSYKMTTEESKQGSILSSLNLVVLQNLRASIAEEKLNLQFTPNDVLTFTQQEAYLKGQLDILAYLLANHEEAQSQQ